MARLTTEVRQHLLRNPYTVRYDKGDITANFLFKTVTDALKRFNDWLVSRLDDLIIEESGVKDDQGHWTDDYLETAYFIGAKNSAYTVSVKTGKPPVPIEPFLKGPVSLDKVKLLKARAYEELQGITRSMSKDLGNILADGIVRGESPRKVAATIAKTITSITKKRAVTIARTETIRAHAEGQLHALEQMGVKKLGVDVEFTPTMISFDPPVFENRVCPKCRALQGKVFTIEESHGIIPVHPNCRCSWVPYF
jgi:SPP1 gp7 family putative phage head morphogenesis protein